MIKYTFALFLLLFLITAADAQWTRQTIDTKAAFRGLSVVSEKIIWASGTGGTVIRTVDAGKTWRIFTVPGAEKLDFRDIEAFDANTAYILSIGNGDASRIYRTIDGGATWQLQFTNKNEKAFFDAIACWDRNNCIAMSDPVDGKYVLIKTTNGSTWGPVNTDEMPAVKEGEAAFAASGTCLITQGKGTVFLVSGGSNARVFRSDDRGLTWAVAATPLPKGTAGSGIFSIAMLDAKNGVIVGGNYEAPNERNNSFAMTVDGGKTWQLGSHPGGYRSAVAYIDRNIVIAVGTNGSDVSFDRRLTWQSLGNENLNAVDAKGKNAVWAVGPSGAVFKLDPASLVNRYEGPALSRLTVPHFPNVDSIELSHNEIRSNCPASNSNCSIERRLPVKVRTTALEIPHEIVYTTSAGRIIGDGPTVEWDLTGAGPGKYTITAGLNLFSPNFGWGVFGRTATKVVDVY